MQIEILTLNEPNKNGRVYTKECLEDAIKRYTKKRRGAPVYGSLGPKDLTLHPKSISHSVQDLRIEGDKVFGTLKVLDTHDGKILKQLLDTEAVAFRPSGTGTIVNGVVTNYSISSVDAIPKEDAA